MEERRPNGPVDKENSQSTDEQPNAPAQRRAPTSDAFTALRLNHLISRRSESALRYNGKPPANLLPEVQGALNDDASQDGAPKPN